MKLTTNLEELRGAISACFRVLRLHLRRMAANHGICPLYERGQSFTATAGGLLYLAKAVLNKQLEYNSELAELAYTCAACGACNNQCVIVRCINPDMALSDIIRLLRYELVKRDLIPEGPIRTMYETVKRNGDLPSDGGGKQKRLPQDLQDANADTLLIADCLHTEAEVASCTSALQLLAKMKEPVSVFSDSGCCGSTLYDFGFWDQLPAMVEKQWKQIQSQGKKELLFVNPHCQEFMTNQYAKVIDDFPGFQESTSARCCGRGSAAASSRRRERRR